MSLIRGLNPNKATGSDDISGQMLLICDESVVLPLMLIFRNILESSIYPDQWKLANVVPMYKKDDKQLSKIIDLYLFYLFADKYLKKLFLTVFMHT